MMAMSAPVSARSTWASLLSELQPASVGYDDYQLIETESAFQSSFKDVCLNVRERDPERLLGRFNRIHDKVIQFVYKLDDSLNLADPSSLNSLFWSIALAVITAALKYDKKEELFRDYFPRLNQAFPMFGRDLCRYIESPRVQGPLQRVFKEYIGCYRIILSQICVVDEPPDFDIFANRVRHADTLFASSKTEWTSLKESVAEIERRLGSSEHSVPNGTLGPLNPFTTAASFEWMRTLGHGTYGHVSVVKETTTGSVYAQKIIRVTEPRLASEFERIVKNEVSIMQKLRHHHIATVSFYVRHVDCFSLIMLPVADCDLLSFLQRFIDAGFPRLERRYLNSFFGCLISALSYAHSNKVKHEDIKPKNILITSDQRPVLTDFGCAKDFSELGNSTSFDSQAFGTPVYWSPEHPNSSRRTDVFALGCVFSELLTVRQARTLEEYQKFRYQSNRDYGYAFRGNLPRVLQWIDGLAIEENDPVGLQLRDQTKKMLVAEKDKRVESKDVRRALRVEGDAVFCTDCLG